MFEKGFHFLTSLVNEDIGCCYLWRVIWGQALICFKQHQLPYIAHSTGRSKYFWETIFYKFSHLQKYCRHTRHVPSIGMRALGRQPCFPSALPALEAPLNAWQVGGAQDARPTCVYPDHLPHSFLSGLPAAFWMYARHLSRHRTSSQLPPLARRPLSSPCNSWAPIASGLCTGHFILLEFSQLPRFSFSSCSSFLPPGKL